MTFDKIALSFKFYHTEMGFNCRAALLRQGRPDRQGTGLSAASGNFSLILPLPASFLLFTFIRYLKSSSSLQRILENTIYPTFWRLLGFLYLIFEFYQRT